MSWLEANGLDQKTVLVVIGDHGEGLGSHGEGTHGYFVYDYATAGAVPRGHPVRRAARGPGRLAGEPGRRLPDRSRASRGRFRAEGPGPVAASRRCSNPADAREVYAYAESMTPSLQFGWSALHCLRSTRYKLIQAPRPELFDLARGPGEETNVFDRNPAVASRMEARLDRLMPETSLDAPAPEAADLDQETLERLAALGYVGGPVSPTDVRREGVARRPQGQAARSRPSSRRARWSWRTTMPPPRGLLESALREDPEDAPGSADARGRVLELGRERGGKGPVPATLV